MTSIRIVRVDGEVADIADHAPILTMRIVPVSMGPAGPRQRIGPFRLRALALAWGVEDRWALALAGS